MEDWQMSIKVKRRRTGFVRYLGWLNMLMFLILFWEMFS